MKKNIFIVLAFITLYSCQQDATNEMVVQGKIKGLKKGTFYLQKQMDSVLLYVDSISVNGSNEFLLKDIVDSPEIYYLTLKNSKKSISFFGEKDTITINSTIDKFEERAVVEGSENQDVLNRYLDIKNGFNDKNLDLIKEEFEAKKTGNQDSIVLVEQKKKNLLKKRYLVAINYAINNGDYEASPYIAITELYDANLKMLDTINNSLSPSVKESKYGVILREYIEERRETGE